jgi:hypothetical protein
MGASFVLESDNLTRMAPILLIGPINAGKTTVATLLSEKLSLPVHSLDAMVNSYATPLGYDAEKYEDMKQRDVRTAYEYRRSFYDEIVTRFLRDHSEGILDFGAGYPVVSDPLKQQRIKEALRPYRNVILLMPSEDVERSLEILRTRNPIVPGETDYNNFYFENGNRMFWEIAKHIVYTDGKTPEETCEEILSMVDRAP